MLAIQMTFWCKTIVQRERLKKNKNIEKKQICLLPKQQCTCLCEGVIVCSMPVTTWVVGSALASGLHSLLLFLFLTFRCWELLTLMVPASCMVAKVQLHVIMPVNTVFHSQLLFSYYSKIKHTRQDYTYSLEILM